MDLLGGCFVNAVAIIALGQAEWPEPNAADNHINGGNVGEKWWVCSGVSSQKKTRPAATNYGNCCWAGFATSPQWVTDVG
jgi:hypothetical protein